MGVGIPISEKQFAYEDWAGKEMQSFCKSAFPYNQGLGIKCMLRDNAHLYKKGIVR